MDGSSTKRSNNNNQKNGGSTWRVIVHAYDLVPNQNNWAHAIGFGLYHTGVFLELLGQEYSFYGADASGQGGGVLGLPAAAGLGVVDQQQAAPLPLRSAIELGCSTLSRAQVMQVLDTLSLQFPGHSYNILTRNCNTFSDSLCQALLGRGVPAWINRAARWGSWFAPSLNHNPATVPPAPASWSAFSGTGYRLTATASESGSTQVPVNRTCQKTVNEPDTLLPITTLQIRLCTGAKVQTRFNHSQTIADLYDFVDSVSAVSSGGYVLVAGYPPRPILATVASAPSNNTTLEQAGLLNAVITQRPK